MTFKRRRSSLFARGEPMVWMTGGALAISLAMVMGLLVLVVSKGMGTFWPKGIVRVELNDGQILVGEITREEEYQPEGCEGTVRRRLIRTGNFDLTGTHFQWVSDFQIKRETRPEWALLLERERAGHFYGEPVAFYLGGKKAVEGPEASWDVFLEHHDKVRERRDDAEDLRHQWGKLNRERDELRLAVKSAELKHGKHSEEAKDRRTELETAEGELDGRAGALRDRMHGLEKENDRYQLRLATSTGVEKNIALANIVRAYAANQLGWFEKLGVYVSRWWEFLWDEPRNANNEGGVFPAIFGTVVMTLIMSVLVVPFGVLAALYLCEYARQGALVSIVRIAVNNLASVPSIVFGVFGLGFFCYIIGGSFDDLFFQERLPNPTYGKGGILWASLTLALLTLPVVIVATEEALAAVPRSMREGSYACGAGKWQTIRRIVLPRAMPGIMTGTILAIARGAGEVAPLMLVGAVKLAPELPVDGHFPFVHPERSFMHLGFHIYDLGFQSQNSEAARPMVFTTTLLLIGIVVLLNLVAIWARARLRRAYL